MKSRIFQPGRLRSVRLSRLSVLLGGLFFLVILALLCPLPGYSPVVIQRAWAASIVTVTTSQQTAQGFQTALATPTTSPTPATSMTSSVNISGQVVRLSQLAPNQYASTQEYNTWAYSACSTASMTEVLNAWWGYQRYKITDVLQQEIAAKAITPSLGLTDNNGIARTMRRFGFDVTTPRFSYEQLIATAQSGTPVIIGWPPSKYQGGHLVVVIGGDANTIKLADSSIYNRQTITRAQFLSWWGGFAAVAKPDPYSIYRVGHPMFSTDFINRVLDAYRSPMRGMGQSILDTLKKYGIDPAIALAFFLHESQMGTTGESRVTKAWGNSRCVGGYACVKTNGDPCPDPEVESCYAAFSSWLQGLDEWGWQLTNPLYAAGGRVLVDDIIPRYAPTADGNDEAGYIASLKHSADTWRAGGLNP